MFAKNRLTITMAGCGAFVWAIPTIVGSTLVFLQYQRGGGSLFLVGIGIVPYLLGMTIAALGPPLLIRASRGGHALALAIVMLGMGLLASFVLWLGLGST